MEFLPSKLNLLAFAPPSIVSQLAKASSFRRLNNASLTKTLA